MKLTKRNMTKGFTLVELLVVIAIIAALAAMATPVIMKQNKKAAMTEATSNAKQIFYLLIEFDQDYGEFPSDATAVDDLSGYTGSTSNDYLAQLIQGGLTKSEEIFYAKGGASTNKKPDNVITNQTDQLAKGECGFAYIKNQSTSDNSGRPILMAPFDTGEAFKPDPYDGKCVVLRIDGAVKQLLLDRDDNKAKIGGGKTLLDTGTDTVWGTSGFVSADLVPAE
ncbi:MAG: prepilin-type N-terminal cleavage/methylation domain-containing protein [Verrucomicrobiae bacterium]|nr:prepilin-type N-terminal cleavage/methylation domain-containing protein [Verrucomicrobiae bacterium]NNJ85591.1 prepilin-type N-terminal cleavage/methylation domain-containing protein [Akkermansiaceae bacterium]